MLICLYVLTIILAFCNYLIFRVYSKIRATCKSKLLVSLLTYLYMPWGVTAFFQPAFLESRFKDVCCYNPFIGVLVYCVVFFLLLYLNRNQLKKEYSCWTDIYS